MTALVAMLRGCFGNDNPIVEHSENNRLHVEDETTSTDGTQSLQGRSESLSVVTSTVVKVTTAFVTGMAVMWGLMSKYPSFFVASPTEHDSFCDRTIKDLHGLCANANYYQRELRFSVCNCDEITDALGIVRT